MSENVKLTGKQKAFVEAYCSNGFNATQAALSAGYSEKTAREMGSENLTKPNIAKAIQDFKDKATDKALVTTEDVVRGLYMEATGDGEGYSSSSRIQAWKALSEFTGGFDANKNKTEITGQMDTVTRIELVPLGEDDDE